MQLIIRINDYLSNFFQFQAIKQHQLKVHKFTYFLYVIFLFWVVFDVIIGSRVWMRGSFSGFIFGYLWYDVGHYAFHHFNIKSGYLKYVRKQHMRHHGSTPDKRFGVSNPFWDFVFGTMPKEEKKKAS